MGNKEECMSCACLVQYSKQINVKRNDGEYERASWFECSAIDAPLPTISKHNLPGCMWWKAQPEKIIPSVH